MSKLIAGLVIAATITLSGQANAAELPTTSVEWTTTSTCTVNTVGGPGGWVCTDTNIPADRECVVHISAQPYRAVVVPDTSPMCDLGAVGYIQPEQGA